MAEGDTGDLKRKRRAEGGFISLCPLWGTRGWWERRQLITRGPLQSEDKFRLVQAKTWGEEGV